MQERVEKYIYHVSEDKYRVKFLKVDKKNNKRINFDQYIDGTLEDAIFLRDKKLEENGLFIEKKSEVTCIFEDYNKDKSKKVNNKPKKPNNKTTITNAKKVDKYIYEIEKGKKYRIFIRKGGSNGKKGDYYSAVFEGTLAQARKERDKKLAELKLKKKNNKNIKFIDFARIYYKEYAEKELSPTTVRSGKVDLKNYILPELANVYLDKISVLTVQRIVNSLKEKYSLRPDKNGNKVKLSLSTINNIYCLLRKILNKALEWDYIEKNPVLKVKAPGVSKEEKLSYNREELLEVLELLKTEDILTETLFTIAICTGVRRGELIGLHTDDIDFNNNVISIRRAVVWDEKKRKVIEKETKTKGSVRDIPIPIFCTEVIKEYLKLRLRIITRFKRKIKGYIPPKNLFLSKNGGIMFPDTPSSKWLDFRKKYPYLKNVSLHGLRHSYCTIQMNENPNLAPADVKRLMGHSQLTTTFHYTHSNKDKKEDAVSIFDKYYNTNKEQKVGFNQMLSLYTKIKFTSTSEINELLNFAVNSDDKNDYKYSLIKDYIDNRYPIFKSINISNVSLDNVFDWLEEQEEIYGSEFILCSIK